MEEFLTPRSTSFIKKEDILNESLNSRSFPSPHRVSNPDGALQALKNEPELETLLSILKLLDQNTAKFSIRSPGPLTSQLLHTLISEIVPSYWPVLGESQNEGLPLEKSGRKARTPEQDILLSCLQSVPGIGAVLLAIKQHIQSIRVSKKDIGGHSSLESLVTYLQVLEGLLDGESTVQRIWHYVSILPESNAQRRALWIEFLSILGGKVIGLAAEAEVLLKQAKKNISAEHWIAESTAYALWLANNICAWVNAISPGEEIHWKACAEVLSKSFRLGNMDSIIKSLLDSLLFQNKQTTSKILALVNSLPNFEQRKVVNSLLKILAKDHLSAEIITEADTEWWKSDKTIVAGAASLIGDFITDAEIRRDQVLTWLTAPSGAGLGDGIAIRRAVIAAFSENKSDLESVVEKSLQQLGDQLYINHVPTMQQEAHAQVLLLAAGQLHRKSQTRFSMMMRAGKHLQLVSKRLAASSIRARFLGMVIAEALSSLVDKGEKRMDFKMDELQTAEALWYKGLVNVVDNIGSLATLQTVTKSRPPSQPTASPLNSDAKPKRKVQKSTVGKVIAIEEISEDGEESPEYNLDSLIPHMKPDSDPDDSDDDPTMITRNKPSAPVYIRTLITYLRSTENYDHQKLGLQNTAALIRRKANFGTELSSQAEVLASLLVGIQDKFELANFVELRLQGMIALVVAQPSTMGPWFAKTFFDGDYSISQRASILTTLGLSARELGGFGTNADTATIGSNSFPSRELPEDIQKRFASNPKSTESTLKPITSLSSHLQSAFLAPLATSLADQSLGPDMLKIRTISSRYKSAKKPSATRIITNTLATIVSKAFFFPLTGRFFLHLKSYGNTAARNAIFQPHLLAHFLRTLAILLHASGPSTLTLPQMTTEFWDLLLNLRTHAIGDASVLEALLFALLTILELNEDKRSLVDENGGRLVETQGWVEGVFERLGSADGEEEVKLRMLAAGVLVRIGDVVEKYQALLVGDLIRLEG